MAKQQEREAAAQAEEDARLVLVEREQRERRDGGRLRVARVGERQHLEQQLHVTVLVLRQHLVDGRSAWFAGSEFIVAEQRICDDSSPTTLDVLHAFGSLRRI